MANGVDWSAMDEISEELKEKEKKQGRGGLVNTIPDFKIKEALKIRMLPPSVLGLNGMYFTRWTRYWIQADGKKRPYLSMETYGDPCVIATTVSEYRLSGDAETIAMLDNWRAFQRSETVLVPCLLMEIAYDTDGNIESAGAKDNEIKIIEFSLKNFNKLHRLVADPEQRRAGGGESVMSRSLGRQVKLVPGAKSNDMQFQPDPGPLDLSDEGYDVYYNPENVPNLNKLKASQVRSDAHLESVVRNYVTGSPLVEDDGVRKAAYLGSEVDPAAAAATPAPAPKPPTAKPAPPKPPTAKATPKPPTAKPVVPSAPPAAPKPKPAAGGGNPLLAHINALEE